MCQCCIEDVPEIEKGDAMLLLILNIVVSGLGTYILGKRQGAPGDAIRKKGIIQFLFSFLFFIGWFWSVYWGITLVLKSEGSIPIKYATVPSKSEGNI